VLRNLAVSLGVSADLPLFDIVERGPDATFDSSSRPRDALIPARRLAVDVGDLQGLTNVLLWQSPANCQGGQSNGDLGLFYGIVTTAIDIGLSASGVEVPRRTISPPKTAQAAV
jgi:hypothetical protein